MAFNSLNIGQSFAVDHEIAAQLMPLYLRVIRSALYRHVSPSDLDDACQEAIWLAFADDWSRVVNQSGIGEAGHVHHARRAALNWRHKALALAMRRGSVVYFDERQSVRNGGPERVELREAVARIEELPEPHRSVLIVATENGHIPGEWRAEAGLSKKEANRYLGEARRLLGRRRQRRTRGDIRREVVKLLRQGWPTLQIAERFGMKRMSVNQIAMQERITLKVALGEHVGHRLARNIGRLND